MSDIEILFVHQEKKDDERINITRTGDVFTLSFKTSFANGKDSTRLMNFASPESVRNYVTTMLHMAVYDDFPCVGIQLFFPGSPTFFYKHSTLKKDEVWDAMLDALDFWLAQAKWPKLPPISPILVPADLTKTELPEFLDLTEPDLSIEYNSSLNQRSVNLKPNKHTYFDENGRATRWPQY